MIDINNLEFNYPVLDHKSQQIRSKFIKLFSKDSNTGKEVNALKNINLKILNGEKVGLIGHNGSGKSTLLRLISGIYFPTKGNIQVKGKVYSILDFSAGIVKDATGIENVFILSYLRGATKSQVLNKLDWIKEFSDLDDALLRPVRTYSSGMIIRLISSVLLSFNPEIFVLDEFFGAGDKKFTEKVREQILKMIKNSGVFLFASHDEVLLKSLCNRIITLENGSIIKDIKI